MQITTWTKEELDEHVISIERDMIKEGEICGNWRNSTDPDEKAELKEDAYICHLRSIKDAKVMGKENYDAEKMQAVFDCEHEELTAKEFEDYLN